MARSPVAIRSSELGSGMEELTVTLSIPASSVVENVTPGRLLNLDYRNLATRISDLAIALAI
jgi:hypothetical protein